MTEAEIKERARLEKNRYMREYREKNKEKIRSINERYWAKKATASAQGGERECHQE